MKHRYSLRLLPLLLAAVLLLGLCGCGAKEQTAKQSLDQFETATLGVIDGSLYAGFSSALFPEARQDFYPSFTDLFQCVKQEKIDGYRITIYLDKGQKARTEAFEARDRFQALFPGEATYVAYEDPYWVVSVGNCTTSDSAMILLGRVSRVFEKAYLVRASIPVEEFLKEIPMPTVAITEEVATE